jgi:hypothetical protein
VRIAYFGYDFFAACFTSLIQAGHEIVCVYSFHADNTWDFNQKLVSQAAAG